MTRNAPDLARAAEALRQLADLNDTFGPHDERLRTCLAASFWLIVERFGDDDWREPVALPPRRRPTRMAARLPEPAEAGLP